MSRQELGGLSEKDRQIYSDIATTASVVAQELGKAWLRPVRNNPEYERAALWNALNLDQACSKILETGDRSRLLRPSIGETAMRYDVETGIRMIPELLPYTAEERYWLRSNPAYQARDFGRGIYDERGLVWHWHLWIWERQHILDEERFVSIPSPDGELLAEGCTRLAEGIVHTLSVDPPHAS
jgi:hypothetical protein